MNKKVIIEGEKVHHVGYRPFLLVKAMELEITKYQAKNLKENGTEIVEVSIGGEEGQINEFIEFIKSNHPPEAKVSKVKDGEPPEYVMPIDEYQKVLSAEQQNKMVQTGLMMVDKQDLMIDKQDETTQKIDNMNANLSQKTDKVTNGIATLDTHVTGRFDTLDTKYGEMTETMKLINQNLEKLTKAILALAEKAT